MNGEDARLVSRLRFSHLRLVVELERCGSLRRASDAMHLTQSALSKSLRELESMLGVRLYERSGAGLQITAEGRALARTATLMLGELGQMRDDVLAVAQGRHASLRVGATPFLALTLLPRVFESLGRAAPGYRVTLVEGRVPELMQGLADGALDALVSTQPLDIGDPVLAGFTHEPLMPANLVVIASPSHPLCPAKRVRWAQLAGERWILPSAPSLVRDVVDRAFVGQGLRPPTPAIESAYPATNLALVAQGIGIAALPGASMLSAERSGIVRRLKVSPGMPMPPVSLVYRRAAVADEKLATLRAALDSALDPPARGRRAGRDALSPPASSRGSRGSRSSP